MKALVIEDVKKASLQDFANPKLTDDGVIIELKANGVCRSDWHTWVGDIPIKNPIIGHEATGVIAEVGRNVKNYKKGDRIIVPFSGSDGTCSCCQQGHTNLCDHMLAPGGSYNGAYAQYMHVPLADRNLIHLPEEISFTDGAALGCRTMTAYHGLIDRVKVRPGEYVVVYGCGGVGLSAINIAAAVGATVIGVDINPKNLELAKAMGAAYTINSTKTNPQEEVMAITKVGAHVGVDALGIPQTCVGSITSLRKLGRHLQVGVTTKAEQGVIPVPVDLIVFKELELYGTLGMPVTGYDALLSLVAQGKLTPGKMVTGEISLSEVPSIFEQMSNFTATGTYVVTDFTK